MANHSDTVLVTGVSGFIGSHVTEKLLSKGYKVRGTVRNLAKGQKVVAALNAAGADTSRLELVEANLAHDAGWADVVKDCRYIQHIASPFPMEAPDNREALVPEARAGTQRVLEHGLSAGAERIVLTSSIVSMIGQKKKPKKFIIRENDWTDPELKSLTAYPVSKTRAELSAWAYVKAQKLRDRLCTVNPGLVLGPDSFGNAGTSVAVIRGMLRGRFPRVPQIAFPIIDVRDCAAIHVAAMTEPGTGGRRLIAASQSYWFRDIAATLQAEFPQAKQLPKGDLPNIVVRIASIFDDSVKSVTGDLGIFHDADTGYVTTLTHVVPRPAREAIIASARSIIDSGAVRLG